MSRLDHDTRRAQLQDAEGLRQHGTVTHAGHELVIVGAATSRGKPVVRICLNLAGSGAFVYLDADPTLLRRALPFIESACEAEGGGR